jgi:hypothetical protein
MATKRYKPEEIVAKLRSGRCSGLAGPGHDGGDVTYYRWRQEFGGLKRLVTLLKKLKRS